jgi:hypothetical protein
MTDGVRVVTVVRVVPSPGRGFMIGRPFFPFARRFR